ncbi:MAG: hypothetical protein KKE17_02180 [Proteobacteria bacterium]|nr:hypothetical protein [Pseudomonadota bacterium]MBU1708788.1 hypothetical protein [Pseudomonadota bacterium]
MNLIHNREKQEMKFYPMERIMSVDDQDNCIRIATTGIHLARKIGEGLVHSYQGQLQFTDGDAEKNIRVIWERD